MVDVVAELKALLKTVLAAAAACEKARDAPAAAEEQRCVDGLGAMRALKLTTAVLLETKVGVEINRLKKHRAKSVVDAATATVTEWRAVVAPKPAAAAATVDRTAKSGAEPPAVSAPPPGPTAVESRPESQGAAATPTPAVDAPLDKSHPETPRLLGDPAVIAARERSREALARGLALARGDAPPACDPWLVACHVESALHTLHPRAPAGGKAGMAPLSVEYTAKLRQLVFNLRDAANPDLRRRVLTGEVAPDGPTGVLLLPPEELASDVKRAANAKMRADALRECERGLKQTASTDQFTCGKCKQKKTTYYQMQTRSADEPMTTFVTCVNCQHRWRFC